MDAKQTRDAGPAPTSPPLLMTPEEAARGNAWQMRHLVRSARFNRNSVPITERTLRFAVVSTSEVATSRQDDSRPLLVDRAEAARLLSISRRILDRLEKRQELVPVRFCRRVVRYRMTDLDRFVETRKGRQLKWLRRQAASRSARDERIE